MERFGSAGEPIWRDPETHTYSCSAGCAVKLFVFQQSGRGSGAGRLGGQGVGVEWREEGASRNQGRHQGHEISSEMPPMGIALQEA